MDWNCSEISALTGAILLGYDEVQYPLCALGMHAGRPSLHSYGITTDDTHGATRQTANRTCRQTRSHPGVDRGLDISSDGMGFSGASGVMLWTWAMVTVSRKTLLRLARELLSTGAAADKGCFRCPASDNHRGQRRHSASLNFGHPVANFSQHYTACAAVHTL